MSEPAILANILQPILDNLKNEIIARNETQVVDAEQYPLGIEAHVFSLNEDAGTTIVHSDHDDHLHYQDHHHDNHHNHDHQHHAHPHHEVEHSTVDNEIIQEVGEIIGEDRKLSMKFSGIADILEKKMEAGFFLFLRNFISHNFIFQPKKDIVWRRWELTSPGQPFCFLDQKR